MKRYLVRIGHTHTLVEVDGGWPEALRLFEERIHPITDPVDLEVQQIFTHIREQNIPAVTRVTRKHPSERMPDAHPDAR